MILSPIHQSSSGQTLDVKLSTLRRDSCIGTSFALAITSSLNCPTAQGRYQGTLGTLSHNSGISQHILGHMRPSAFTFAHLTSRVDLICARWNGGPCLELKCFAPWEAVASTKVCQPVVMQLWTTVSPVTPAVCAAAAMSCRQEFEEFRV